MFVGNFCSRPALRSAGQTDWNKMPSTTLNPAATVARAARASKPSLEESAEKAATAELESATPAATIQDEMPGTPAEQAAETLEASKRKLSPAEKADEKATQALVKAEEAKQVAAYIRWAEQAWSDWFTEVAEQEHAAVTTAGQAMLGSQSTLEGMVATFADGIGEMVNLERWGYLGYVSGPAFVQDTLESLFGNVKPGGTIRNELIRLSVDWFPIEGKGKLAQKARAAMLLTDVSTVNRVLKGNDTGGGINGHGGAREGSNNTTAPAKKLDGTKVLQVLDGYLANVDDLAKFGELSKLANVAQRLSAALDMHAAAAASKLLSSTEGTQGRQA